MIEGPRIGVYIEREWCPYCFVLDTVKGQRGPIQLVRRQNGGRGRPSHLRFATTAAFAEHVVEVHPHSYTAVRLFA